MSKKLLNEVFKEEKSEKLLNEVSGGLTKAQCNQILPCGNGTSACELYNKYCK